MSPPLTERLKLTIAYDGRPFRGWQSQATGDAVQDAIEAVLLRILGAPTRIHGAGRTDAGVHAYGQVAHLDVPAGRMAPQRWARALNDQLPAAIRIIEAEFVAADFHARMDAVGKVYTYRIWHGTYLHPLEIGRAWMVPGRLDQERLEAGARLLEGAHDFASFAGHRRQPEENTRRTVYGIAVAQAGPLWTLRFHGDGFLYHMVRMLTGSLVRCASGRAELTWLHDLLARHTPEKTRYCAPAEGLYLTEVLYAPSAGRG